MVTTTPSTVPTTTPRHRDTTALRERLHAYRWVIFTALWAALSVFNGLIGGGPLAWFLSGTCVATAVFGWMNTRQARADAEEFRRLRAEHDNDSTEEE